MNFTPLRLAGCANSSRAACRNYPHHPEGQGVASPHPQPHRADRRRADARRVPGGCGSDAGGRWGSRRRITSVPAVARLPWPRYEKACRSCMPPERCQSTGCGTGPIGASMTNRLPRARRRDRARDRSSSRLDRATPAPDATRAGRVPREQHESRRAAAESMQRTRLRKSARARARAACCSRNPPAGIVGRPLGLLTTTIPPLRECHRIGRWQWCLRSTMGGSR